MVDKLKIIKNLMDESYSLEESMYNLCGEMHWEIGDDAADWLLMFKADITRAMICFRTALLKEKERNAS